MNICKNCKHWGKGDEQDWIGPCEHDGKNLRFCAHEMVGNAYKVETIRDNGVTAFYEGGCTGELCTGPDFGCIHFSS